jgi:hypothetical protein
MDFGEYAILFFASMLLGNGHVIILFGSNTWM